MTEFTLRKELSYSFQVYSMPKKNHGMRNRSLSQKCLYACATIRHKNKLYLAQ
jgi:hypothetical protein